MRRCVGSAGRAAFGRAHRRGGLLPRGAGSVTSESPPGLSGFKGHGGGASDAPSLMQNIDERNWQTAELAPMTDPSVWTGNELVHDKHWMIRLTEAERQDIVRAAEDVLASGSIEYSANGLPENITPDNFRLKDKLIVKLDEWAENLENGTGVVMIDNFPIEGLSRVQIATAYLGLSSYMGRWVPQSSAGLRSESRGFGLPMGEVRAEMKGATPTKGRQANNYFRLHTDRCDCISLLGIRTAKAGGHTRICSATKVYNVMLERHPELARSLFRPFPRIWEGSNGLADLPVWAVCDGKFTTQFSPSYTENSQLLPAARKLSPDEVEALDLVEEIGVEVGHRFLQGPGQLYFLNNHQVYHGRSSWQFDEQSEAVADKGQVAEPDGGEGRLLYRIWLSPYNSRRIPDTPLFRRLWGSIEAGLPRGGLDPAMRSGLTEKPQELVKQVESGTHEYYGMFKRKFREDARFALE